MQRLLFIARVVRVVLVLGLSGVPLANTFAQTPATVAPTAPQGKLYVVEIKTGPQWDANKPAHEQSKFREHSANLKAIRDQGRLVLGARYADKGLIVVESATEQEARALFEQDPSIAEGIFAYTIFEFNVFYSGTVNTRKRTP